MICPEYLVLGLEQVFTDIQLKRMQDVPVLNPALRVEAVGFVPWQGYCLGVLVTPWFMNLMLLPNEGDEMQGLSVGEKITQVFQSGAYEFIVGNEEGIGRYQMCSLFSPMFDFVDHHSAVVTAEAVMQGLMDEANVDPTNTREKEIARLWQGEPAGGSVEADEKDLLQRPTLEERLQKPISRRDLLRGNLSREP